MEFYKCGSCQSIALEVIAGEDACEKSFGKLDSNCVEASNEKHLPAVERDGDTITVTVGSVEHPMLEEHYIMFIYLETCCGGILKKLKPNDAPKAVFQVPKGETPKAVYEYCNIHGLWKTEIA
ncbi:desulfoferrodoxin family protein [Qiania dongpingensis]|uniref:Desulfoferrodoxin n=1 Tax=Qiania dongpingensis TaxID=2763669 RepID=A0A7G9G1L7_9FIRM|nr:desulfoferrodoxin family protein [Qiania dongpingensis]QNM04699.1 desulfoferrodoxin [Qiania dongpingensis]